MKEIICHSASREETCIKHAGWTLELFRRIKIQVRVARWVVLALALTTGGTASALNINLTYDPDATFTAAGLTAADIVNMKAAMTYAKTQFTSRYTDSIDVNIQVTAVPGTSTLGESSTALAFAGSYASLRAAMVSDSTTADDATALAAGGSLPAADPIGGTHDYLLARAEAKALGLAANDLSNDGTFTFGGGFSYTYDPNNRAVAGKIDFIGVAMHEISEIMGRIGLMGENLTGNPDYMLFDLFHYTGAGVRGLNNGANRSFSINNGTTLLKAFNNAAMNGGDLQDWASGTNDSFNAFSSDGVQNDLTAVDLRVMDAIGYNFSVAPPVLQSAVSRKVHGGAGTFDINLPQVAIGGAVGIECRTSAGAHQIVATFANPVTVGGVSVTSGTGSVGGSSVSGAVVTINLTGVTNAQRLGITLANVSDGANTGDVTIPMGVLAGDTSGNGSVTATDVSQTKGQSGQPVTGANFREDVVVNGSINATDVAAVKSNSGTALP